MIKTRTIYLSVPCLAGLVVLCLAAANLGAAGPAARAGRGGTCTVPGDHATIQAAVDDPACNLVDIAPGTISEHVTIPTGRIVDIQGQGEGVTFVDGMAGGPIFFIEPGAVVSLCYMTIHNGSADYGAGVYNHGTLAVISAALIDNQVSLRGGAIFNNAGAMATLAGITLTGNTAGDQGGAIENAGQMTVTDSSFAGNSAGEGGAIYSSGDALTVLNSTLTGNTATGGGGGIVNFSGTVTVTESLVSGNAVGILGRGGGIHNDATGTLTLESSTVSGNSAGTKSSGGGIFNEGLATVNSSTLSANMASYGGGIANPSGTVAFTNTILANNIAFTNGPDCWGNLTSQDFNLVSDDGGCTVTGSTGHNIIALDPLLGPLQDNGGPTWTMALAGNSPAVDAGFCPTRNQDQRGFPRPVDVLARTNAADGCDMGAFEYQYPWQQFWPVINLLP